MPIQLKFTLVFLVTGIIGAITVSTIANWMIVYHIQKEAIQMELQNFQQDALGYMQEYGGWENGMQQESFEKFVMRMRHHDWQTNGLRGTEHSVASPPPPNLNNEPAIRRPGPLVQFAIIGRDGLIQNLHLEGFAQYSKAPDYFLKKSTPISFDGQVQIYMHSMVTANLSPEGKQYIVALRKALWTGIGTALILAIILGIFFGKGLTSSLKNLTVAIRSMQQTQDQEIQVPISSKDELGELALAFNQMNSEISRAYKELKALTIRDDLTGLFNRRYLNEQVSRLYEQATRYHQPLTVMIGDLDLFKKINDDFSHATGDDVLRNIGKLLTENTRKCDVVARYGGEEFIIIFPNSHLMQAAECCEKIRGKIENYTWSDIHPNLVITISMGLSADLSALSIDNMIAQADNNLYIAKQQGRNRIVTSLSN